MSVLEPELTRAEIAHIRRQRPENQDAWYNALPPYASLWWPVENALGDRRAAAVREAGALLYV